MFKKQAPVLVVFTNGLSQTGNYLNTWAKGDSDASSVFDRDARSPAIQTNDRKAVKHRLNHGVAAGVVECRKQEKIIIGINIQGLLPGQAAGEMHPSLQAEAGGKFFGGSHEVTAAYDGESGVGIGFVQRLDGQINSFESDNISDKENSQRPCMDLPWPGGKTRGLQPDSGHENGFEAKLQKGAFHFPGGNNSNGSGLCPLGQDVKGGGLNHIIQVAKYFREEGNWMLPGEQGPRDGFDAADRPPNCGDPVVPNGGAVAKPGKGNMMQQVIRVFGLEAMHGLPCGNHAT